MKILCVSDIVDPLVDSVGARERFGDVGMVLSAGDLPMEYLSYIMGALNKPLLFVFGNHNLSELPRYRPGAGAPRPAPHDYDSEPGVTYAGFRSVNEAGLIVMGFCGSAVYNKGPNQFTQAQMWARVLAMTPRLLANRLLYGRAVDLVLTHAAPRDVQDGQDPCHRGFSAFLWLMRVWKPRWLVHGHVHLYDARESRLARYRDTAVINACGHYVLDTEAAGAEGGDRA